jgi:hypothetical protein
MSLVQLKYASEPKPKACESRQLEAWPTSIGAKAVLKIRQVRHRVHSHLLTTPFLPEDTISLLAPSGDVRRRHKSVLMTWIVIEDKQNGAGATFPKQSKRRAI